ncbi:alpha/beta fold hydrolase [Nocardia rhizosphaerae]|uniref:Alpha/beta fold hydrolase n=1 Tax=Nocardia rhizosphaerae TaxID=1691571 RepID=A0ABV8KYP8_9NOCA
MTTSPMLATRIRAIERRVADTYGLTTTERYLTVGHPAVRIRALTTAESGLPVLWINGITAPALAFAPLLARLPGFRHVLVDLPGHNLAAPYRWQDGSVRAAAVGVLTGLLDELGIDSTQVASNSLGGLFTLWTALDAPGRITRAVLLGAPATALPGTRPTAGMAATATPVRGRLDEWLMGMPSPRFLARAALTEALGADTARAMSDDLLDLHRLPLRLPGRAASYRALLRRLLDGRTPRGEVVLTEAELRRIGIPTLFLWGERDAFQSPDHARRSVAAMPAAEFVTLAGGHNPWLDDTPRCADLIGTFLCTPTESDARAQP